MHYNVKTLRPVRYNMKTKNSSPCKIVTPENSSSNFSTRDYVGDNNNYANFWCKSVGWELLPN